MQAYFHKFGLKKVFEVKDFIIYSTSYTVRTLINTKYVIGVKFCLL